MTITLEPPIDNVKMTNLTGRFVRPDGTAITGMLTFSPPQTLLLRDSPLMAACAAEVTLDFNGQFSTWLISTDNPDMSPAGWTYTVTETLDCGPKRRYSIFLPYSAQPVDLAEIAPSTPYSGHYLPTMGPAGPAGPAGTATGGMFNVPAIVAADEEAKRLPLTAAGTPTGVHLVGGHLHFDTSGLWAIAGTIDVASASPAPATHELETWLQWTEDGEPRTTQVTSRSGMAGGGSKFTNRFDVLVTLPQPTLVYLYSTNNQTDGFDTTLSGRLGVSLLMPAPAEVIW